MLGTGTASSAGTKCAAVQESEVLPVTAAAVPAREAALTVLVRQPVLLTVGTFPRTLLGTPVTTELVRLGCRRQLPPTGCELPIQLAAAGSVHPCTTAHWRQAADAAAVGGGAAPATGAVAGGGGGGAVAGAVAGVSEGVVSVLAQHAH